MNAAVGVGYLGYGRVPEVGKLRLRPGGQAQRLGCVDEVHSRGFHVHKVQGRTAPAVDLSREPV